MIPDNLPAGTRLICVDNTGLSSTILRKGALYRLSRYKGHGYIVLQSDYGMDDDRGWMRARFEVAVNADGSDYQAPDDVDLQPMRAEP